MASSGKQHYGLPTLVDQPVAADSAALTFVTLTDSSGGTASDTVVDSGAAYAEATNANQLASITRAVNRLGADLVAMRVEVRAVTDALQAYGLVASS
jgi:hypothetical protein